MRKLEQLDYNNSYARLPEIFFSEHQPKALTNDFLIHFNPVVAELLGLDAAEAERQDFLDIFTTRKSFEKFRPVAACYAGLANQLADAVTEHATPVGSGTVARTQRIPIEKRAESAVIAWLRHQTTAYDNMKIARVKGKRREVRRMLAEESRILLDKYRKGQPADTASCPLQLTLAQSGTKGNTT